MAPEQGDEPRDRSRVGDGVLMLLLDGEEAEDEAGLLLDVLAAGGGGVPSKFWVGWRERRGGEEVS